MYLIIVLIVAFVLFMMAKAYISANKIRTWNPFKLWAMTTVVKRKDGTTFKRPFKRFEYIGQETEEGTVMGIYFVRTNSKSKEELKYEELVKKWK